MYACPDCKTSLHGLWCSTCKTEFPVRDGFPLLVPRGVEVDLAESVFKTYDRMYSQGRNIWEDQGRTPQFIEFFAGRLAELSRGCILEIGCGEGFLLAAIDAETKAAVDPSAQALARAARRTQATLAVAVAENLPFPSNSFDLVAAVGVMEHFFDDRRASREIARVLRPNGWYVTLIHTERTIAQRLQQKVSEYVFPRPRPLAAGSWLLRTIFRPRNQPVQNGYTLTSGRACLENSGLEVREILHLGTHPDLPFVGPHVVAYVARKSAVA
jgi:SAM-dependent methyltransferase